MIFILIMDENTLCSSMGYGTIMNVVNYSRVFIILHIYNMIFCYYIQLG